MTEPLLGVLGGLGLFLLGMAIMTDGLKSFAGDSLRNQLARFTRSPLTGAATGMVSTAILQSSSATTVMAVGFAGAGLLTFAQALGIIFGANIGSTFTGWLVVLLGFKLDLAKIVMPLIFAGALMRVIGKRRVAASGFALAGFGLMFAGINTLQVAMKGFEDFVTPDSFPTDSISGRVLLVLIGIGVTLVTQASSAGVAMAIAAVYAGNISLAQACALVIGMDIGTTVTAFLATIGGTVNAKRTGIAHVVFNLLTGAGAFVLLPWFVTGWDWLAVGRLQKDREIAVVSFHTTFNVLGVLLVLPFTNQFARLIEWLVPTETAELTRRLEPSLLTQSSVALDAVQGTLQELAATVFRSMAILLTGRGDPDSARRALEEAERAIAETREYLGRIQTASGSSSIQSLHANALHVVDHLVRLVRRGRMQDQQHEVQSDKEMRQLGNRLAAAMGPLIESEGSSIPFSQGVESVWNEIDRKMEPFRHQAISESARGTAGTNQTIASLDAYRWLRRVSYHAWRIAFHLDPTTAKSSESPEFNDVLDDDDVFLQNHSHVKDH